MARLLTQLLYKAALLRRDLLERLGSPKQKISLAITESLAKLLHGSSRHYGAPSKTIPNPL
jgi:hypothetical protein